jgi:Rps23 Pro-64 3,4-dihydroxylase Tpa1-like proline 4-hydroxylase
MKYFENFLDSVESEKILNALYEIKEWKNFNRHNSQMKEYYGHIDMVEILRMKLHSKKFMTWIQDEIGIDGLVVDSFGTGEGISMMSNNDKLDSHIDFNWNERIKMHRSLNLILYFGNCEGGNFYIMDEQNKNIIFEKEPKHNSAIMFKHSESNSHGVKPVISGNRFAIRQFYYKSENICNNPHQSLYWYNPKKKMKTNSNV